MTRTTLMRKLRRALRLALACERFGLGTLEAIERERAAASAPRLSRREVLAGGAAAAVALAAGGRPARAVPRHQRDVGIVGAGLAGLACADRFLAAGVTARIYEARSGVGGRCSSLRGFFPGQVAERGGEFIDTLHKTMLGYAQRFDLDLEDVAKDPGEVVYFFDGGLVPEAVVVDEFRAVVGLMRDDLRQSSGAPTADDHTDVDAALDHISLAEYLATRGAGPLISEAVISAYEGEFGLNAAEQSCLNLLLFIHLDKRAKFTPFGVFSDERYHLVDGNDAIATGLAAGIGPIEFGRRLLRVRKLSDGRIELTFQSGGGTVTRAHDVVVITLPFTVLRGVELDASLGLPAWKTAAIEQLGYGTNAKTMLAFAARPWIAQGGNGTAYADLPSVQVTWETNAARATATRGIVTDYASGARGAALRPSRTLQQAEAFLADFDRIFPGVAAAARRDDRGRLVAHLAHWPSDPFALGSYTCYTPGQFTSIAGNEGKPVGNLHFAGEHANSFYEFQGFMEGACLSGIDAADAILRAT